MLFFQPILKFIHFILRLYRLGEHYYKPQLDYMENRKGRAKTPPTAKTFAERFAEDP